MLISTLLIMLGGCFGGVMCAVAATNACAAKTKMRLGVGMGCILISSIGVIMLGHVWKVSFLKLALVSFGLFSSMVLLAGIATLSVIYFLNQTP